MVSEKKGHIDWYILVSVTAFLLFSIAFVYSASAAISEARLGGADRLFWNHTIRVLLGLITILVFAKIDYHLWERLSLPIIIISILLLVSVFLIGTKINNAYRWINLGLFNFQPSEIAKFALVIHVAALLAQRQEIIKRFKFGLLPLLLWTGIITALIAIQPNLSSAVVIFLISFTLMFIGNTNIFHLFLTAMGFICMGGIYALIAPYRRQRLFSFIGIAPGGDFVDLDKFQVNQAIIAFGNGGIFGVGPGESRQSHLFLPESYGDFIYSIIGEEYGFIGAIAILLLFALIFWRGFLIIKKAPDDFGYYLATGILITFAYYTIVSAGVNSGLLPTTGLPMPFISYGGTAVIFYSAAIGILLNISAQAGVFPRKKGKGKGEN